MAEDIETQCPARGPGLTHSTSGDEGWKCAECGVALYRAEPKDPLGKMLKPRYSERMRMDDRWDLIDLTPQQELDLLQATTTRRQFSRLKLLRWIYRNRRSDVD